MKLHLPKLLLTAVLAAVMMSGTAYAHGTGWNTNSAGTTKTLYVGGNAANGGLNSTGVGTVSSNATNADGDLITSIESVDVSAYDGNLKNFIIGADGENNQHVIASIGELVVNAGSTVNVAVTGWGGSSRHFESLTVDTLTVKDEGAVAISVTSTEAATFKKISGTLSSVTNAGTLTIGETGGTTYLSGNLTNTGTQTFEGNVSFVGAGPGNGNTNNTGFVITNAGTTTFKNGVISANVEGGILLSVQNGANVIVGGGDTVTTMELKQLRLHDGSTSTTEVFTIKDNAIVNITDNDTGSGTAKCAVVLGHWHNGTSKLNVEGGKLNVLNGTIKLGGDSNSEMNITGGTVNAKAITFDTSADDDILNLDGGRLNIGSGGISHENYSDRRTLKLTSGTLGALAEIINITNVPTTIGGQFAIDTAIVNAEGEKTGDVASISFTNGVTMTTDAALTIKGGGSVSFGDSLLTVTNTITVLDGTELEFGDIKLDVSEWTPDRTSMIYTEDGATVSASGNGFILDSSDYLLFDGYEWEGNVTNSGFTVTAKDGDTYVVADKVLGSVYYVINTDYEVDGESSFIAQQATAYDVAAGRTLTISADQSTSMTVDKILAEVSGEGNVKLLTSAQLNSVHSQATGTLTIGDGSTENITLSIGGKWKEDNNSYKNNSASISSFSHVILDKATIVHNAISSEINNLTVTENGGSFNIQDQNVGTPINFAGTTTLNGNLAIATSWKFSLNIEALSGSGTLSAAGGGGTGDHSSISVGSLKDFTGSISVTKGSGNFNLSMTTGGAASLNGIELKNGAVGAISNTDALELGTLTLSGGSSLTLRSSAEKASSATIGKLTGNGNLVINDTHLTAAKDRNITISSLENYSGVVQFSGLASGMNLNVAENLGLTVRYSSHVGNKDEIKNHMKLENIGAGNTLILAGSRGYLSSGAVIAADIQLVNADGRAGLELNDGYFAVNTFTGNISGAGNLVINKDNLQNHGLTFTGDVSGWEGIMDVAKGTHTITYTGDASAVGNSQILVRGGSTADIVFDHTKAATVTAPIVINGNSTLNLVVKNTAAEGTTFSGSVQATTATIKAGTVAKFTNAEVQMTNLLVETGAQLTFTAKDALNVSNLEVANVGTITVDNGDAAGSLSASGAVTLAGGATINAAVVDLSGASSVSFDVTSGAIALNGALTMSSTEAFVAALGDSLAGLTAGDILAVFTGVSSFTVGEVTYDASNALTNVDLRDWGADAAVGQYTLTYDTSANVGSIVITVGEVIPEPTTATLSLLALMGLAARRRRK